MTSSATLPREPHTPESGATQRCGEATPQLTTLRGRPLSLPHDIELVGVDAWADRAYEQGDKASFAYKHAPITCYVARTTLPHSRYVPTPVSRRPPRVQAGSLQPRAVIRHALAR